ncbi:MAG TPA: hypothetical protein PKD85_01540 [Saprospiraceae bacterium]|nr:hypothetical protein [Saprospiraceae bacterium]
MSNLIKKEENLYNATINATHDKEFFIAFYDYFQFLSNDFLEIVIDNIIESVLERRNDQKNIEKLYEKILSDTKNMLLEIEKLVKKLQLQDEGSLNEDLSTLKRLLNGDSTVIGGEFLDTVNDYCVDVFDKLIKLGHTKKVEKYIKLSKYNKTESVITLEKRKEFYAKRDGFNKKDARSKAGAFFRLFELFLDITKQENGNLENIEINLRNFLDVHKEKYKNIEYGQLMSGSIQTGNHYSKEKYLADIEILHNAIKINFGGKDNPNDQIFYIKDGNIYHYQTGIMSYNLNGLKEPKYITMFKNIINYMPTEKTKIRISEFEKNIIKKDRCGSGYRANLGQSAKSFNNFLRKNGVQNIHPKTRESVLSVTDEFINFCNKI